MTSLSKIPISYLEPISGNQKQVWHLPLYFIQPPSPPTHRTFDNVKYRGTDNIRNYKAVALNHGFSYQVLTLHPTTSRHTFSNLAPFNARRSCRPPGRESFLSYHRLHRHHISERLRGKPGKPSSRGRNFFCSHIIADLPGPNTTGKLRLHVL